MHGGPTSESSRPRDEGWLGVLRNIASGTAAATGQDFFRLLVQHLADTLDVSTAFITQCADPEKRRGRALAFLHRGSFVDLEYDFDGTPCRGVVDGSVRYYPCHLARSFPDVSSFGLESYLAVPIRDGGGEVLGLLGVADDGPMPLELEPDEVAILEIFAARAGAEIERLRALDALREARDGLEQRVVERTLELSRANAELDAYAHSVAHDLRNPLTGVLANAQLLLSDRVPPERRKPLLASIVATGRKMNAIIAELLTLAEMREDQEVIHQPLDMPGIVADACTRLSHEIEAERAEIVTPSAWPTALGHGPWVEEVWTNYLSNGLKYGGRPPRLECGATTGPSSIRFWVRDNGPGLASDELDRLFRPFVRLHPENVTGHGLGLSIVHRIVTRLGGTVGAENAPSGGAVFYFTLPRCPEPRVGVGAGAGRPEPLPPTAPGP